MARSRLAAPSNPSALTGCPSTATNRSPLRTPARAAGECGQSLQTRTGHPSLGWAKVIPVDRLSVPLWATATEGKTHAAVRIPISLARTFRLVCLLAELAGLRSSIQDLPLLEEQLVFSLPVPKVARTRADFGQPRTVGAITVAAEIYWKADGAAASTSSPRPSRTIRSHRSRSLTTCPNRKQVQRIGLIESC
jgi:hypothetical protein